MIKNYVSGCTIIGPTILQTKSQGNNMDSKARNAHHPKSQGNNMDKRATET